MPDQTLELSPATPNAADANAKVATQLADQGRELAKPTTIEGSLEGRDALEALRTAVVKKKADDAAAKEDDEGATPVVEKKDEKAVASPSVKDKDADKQSRNEASDATLATDKTDVTPTTVPDKSDDIFKGINLPPNIKPKSAEAFAAVKTKALEEISARDTRLTELEKQLKELEEKSKQPADENLLKELEEHRNFRTKFDIEADPRFKAFDKDIADTHNFVYAQLLKTGKISQENIDQIKKYGGPSKVNLEKIFEAINDPTVRRIVESKVADEEMLLFKKEQAIKEKKDDVAGYLKEREESFSKAASAHNDATKKHFSTITAKLDWIKEKSLPKDADDAVKAEVKSHNEFVAATKKDLEAALLDDSPDMRAILLAGMGQLLNLQRVHDGVNKKLETTQKQLEDATAKLTAIKNAGKSRLPESSAPPNAKTPELKKDDYTTPAGDSIEAIRKKILAERAEKANA